MRNAFFAHGGGAINWHEAVRSDLTHPEVRGALAAEVVAAVNAMLEAADEATYERHQTPALEAAVRDLYDRVCADADEGFNEALAEEPADLSSFDVAPA